MEEEKVEKVASQQHNGMFRTPTEEQKKTPEFWFELSNYLASIRVWDGALECCKKGGRFKVDPAEINYRCAIIYLRQENYGKAKRYLKKAIKIEPNYYDALLKLGEIYENQKNFDLAREYYEQAAKCGGERVKALNSIGRLYEFEGFLMAAEDCYRDAVKKNPRDIRSLKNLMLILEKTKRFQEALECAKDIDKMEGKSNFESKLRHRLLLRLRKVCAHQFNFTSEVDELMKEESGLKQLLYPGNLATTPSVEFFQSLEELSSEGDLSGEEAEYSQRLEQGITKKNVLGEPARRKIISERQNILNL